MELKKKWKVDEETNAETWMPSKKRRKMNTWRDYINHEIDVSNELDADFDVSKIHMISHMVEQIHRYGALQLYFAGKHDEAHKPNLKDDWNPSNHNLN